MFALALIEERDLRAFDSFGCESCPKEQASFPVFTVGRPPSSLNKERCSLVDCSRDNTARSKHGRRVALFLFEEACFCISSSKRKIFLELEGVRDRVLFIDAKIVTLSLVFPIFHRIIVACNAINQL